MILEIYIPDSIALDPDVIVERRAFLQAMTNRRCVGALRYGDRPKKRQRYLSRMARELRFYRQAGNFEQLLNIGVYAFCESVAPENPKLHFDPTADSVTREEFGGNIA